MKRIVIIVDGTRDEEGSGDDTNVALDPKSATGRLYLIKTIGGEFEASPTTRAWGRTTT
jgi:hypothetical protein